MTSSLIGRALIGMRVPISVIDSVIIVGNGVGSRDAFRLYSDPVNFIGTDGKRMYISKFTHTAGNVSDDEPNKVDYINIYTEVSDATLITDVYVYSISDTLLYKYGEGMPLKYMLKSECILDTVIPFKDSDLNYAVEVKECKKIKLK